MTIRPVTNAETTIAVCHRELMAELAGEVLSRCDLAAACSDKPSNITRTFCSPAMARFHQVLREWMQSAGMTCHRDAAANLVGRWEGNTRPPPATLIVGSHLDTVPDGGRYDGMLGVLLGLALVEALARSGARLPFAIEVVGFSEEEGVRYATPHIGSMAMAGQFEPGLLERVDADGIMLADALRNFGGSPEDIASAAVDPRNVVAFLEAHIEQGPVLQCERLSLGVVSAIAGQTRAEVCLRGAAGHAGTVPMDLRRDALAAAAEWILQVEGIGRGTSGLVATVGVVEVSPNAGNVIPGDVRLRLDVRHADDSVRESAVDALREFGEKLSVRRSVVFEYESLHEQPAATMDKSTSDLLEQSIADAGLRPLKLVSGAGHDAAVMAERIPTAMLLIRCRDGLSHHPDESVELEDVTHALIAMWHFVQRLASRKSEAFAAGGQGGS